MNCPHQTPGHRTCAGCKIEVRESGVDAKPQEHVAGGFPNRQVRCSGELEEDGYTSCGCQLDEDELAAILPAG